MSRQNVQTKERILSCNDTSQEGRYVFESSNKEDELVLTVSSQETDRARLAVGTHHGPTRIHLADYSLRHQRDGNAGTAILYHLRIYRRAHSLSVMTTGRRELLEQCVSQPHPPGPQDLSRDYGLDEAAGGLSRSTPRQADDTATRPSGVGRRVSPTTGTRSQTTCYTRRGTGRACSTIPAKVLFI